MFTPMLKHVHTYVTPCLHLCEVQNERGSPQYNLLISRRAWVNIFWSSLGEKPGTKRIPPDYIINLFKKSLGKKKLSSLGKKSRKVGNAQFANFDLIFKFAIEFGNHCHLFFMVRPSLF